MYASKYKRLCSLSSKIFLVLFVYLFKPKEASASVLCVSRQASAGSHRTTPGKIKSNNAPGMLTLLLSNYFLNSGFTLSFKFR